MTPDDWIVIPIAIMLTLCNIFRYVYIFIKLNEPYRKMKKAERETNSRQRTSVNWS